MTDYDDPRAHALREDYHAVFGGDELPVPVESIAEDLLGLAVEARELDVSGMLLPAERRILVNAAEPEPRRRFTIAHELGHWICQCVGNDAAQPVYCRAEDVGVDPEAKALEREANIFAANLLMPRRGVVERYARGEGEDSFGVSREALQWRLFGFGLISEKPAGQA
jgi:Zn-dependent peptidase ImmA (M78 family)